MFTFKKKWNSFSVVVYKKDLNIDLSKILFSSTQNGVKEYVFVPHTDTPDEHYHVYMKFENPVTKENVEKLFFKTKCFISPIRESDSVLGLLVYYTQGFRLPFESNFTTKIEELRRNK